VKRAHTHTHVPRGHEGGWVVPCTGKHFFAVSRVKGDVVAGDGQGVGLVGCDGECSRCHLHIHVVFCRVRGELPCLVSSFIERHVTSKPAGIPSGGALVPLTRALRLAPGAAAPFLPAAADCAPGCFFLPPAAAPSALALLAVGVGAVGPPFSSSISPAAASGWVAPAPSGGSFLADEVLGRLAVAVVVVVACKRAALERGGGMGIALDGGGAWHSCGLSRENGLMQGVSVPSYCSGCCCRWGVAWCVSQGW
jgi:hypothetical protein